MLEKTLLERFLDDFQGFTTALVAFMVIKLRLGLAVSYSISSQVLRKSLFGRCGKPAFEIRPFPSGSVHVSIPIPTNAFTISKNCTERRKVFKLIFGSRGDPYMVARATS